MLNRHRKLRMEKMEARQLMAGDVSAVMQSGTLVLTEAVGHVGGNQSVLVSQTDTGKIRVEGTTAADGGVSKINNQPAQEFTVTGGLVVRFGAGSDSVKLIRGIGVQINLKDVQIDVADPGEIITRTPTTPTVSTYTPFRADKDFVSLEHVHTVGSVSIKTGDDVDTVKIIDSLIGDTGGATANLTINTGAGSDLVDFKPNRRDSVAAGSVDIQTFKSSEADQDFVFIKQLGVGADLKIRTGAGNDTILLTNVGAKKLDFDAGAGNDTGILEGVHAIDSLMAKMGEGDDSLTTTNLFSKELTLDGGAGYDSLIKNADPLTSPKRTQTGWDVINGIKMVTLATPVGMATML